MLGRERRSANRRTARLSRSRRQTASVGASDRRHGRPRARRPRREVGRAARARRRPVPGARAAPATAARRALARRPRTAASASGMPERADGRRAVRRLVRRVRPAERAGRGTRRPSAVGLELVEPAVPAALDDQRLRPARPGAARAAASEPLEMDRAGRRRRRRHGRAGRAGRGGRDGARGADLADAVAPRPEVDAGREPGERHGDRVRDRQVGEAERLAGEAVRIRRGGGRDDGRDARIRGGREERADPAQRVAGDRPDRDLRPRDQRLERGERVGPELAGADRQRLGAGSRRGRGRRS